MTYFFESRQHSLTLIKNFLDREDLTRVAEPLYQMIKDLYFEQKNSEPKESILFFSDKIGIRFNPSEKKALSQIEESLRQEQKYSETCKSLKKSDLESIFNKIKDFRKTIEKDSK